MSELPRRNEIKNGLKQHLNVVSNRLKLKMASKEKSLTYKDFEIDEGTISNGALIIDLDDLRHYTINILRLLAEQLRLLDYQKITEHHILVLAVREQLFTILDHTTDEDTVQGPVPDKPITIYVINHGLSNRSVSRIFNGSENYYLVICNGIPIRMLNYYPDLIFLTVFDLNGNLTEKSVDFKDFQLEIIDKAGVYIYKHEDNLISEKEALALIKQLSQTISEASCLISQITVLISSYLLSW